MILGRKSEAKIEGNCLIHNGLQDSNILPIGGKLRRHNLPHGKLIRMRQ